MTKKNTKKKFKKLSIIKTRKYFLALFLILILVSFLLVIQKLGSSKFSCIKSGSDLKCEWKECYGQDRVIILNHEGYDNRLQTINEDSGSITFTDLDGIYEPILICGDEPTLLNSFSF